MKEAFRDRTWVLSTGLLVLVFLIWNVKVRGGLADEILLWSRRKAATAGDVNSMLKRGEISEEMVRRAEDARKEMSGRLQALIDKTAFRPTPRFVPDSNRALETFGRIRTELIRDLKPKVEEVGVKWSHKIQNLGFNAPVSDEAQARDQLVRLEMVHRIILTIHAVAAERVHRVREVKEIDPFPDQPGGIPGGVGLTDGLFVNRIRVRVKFEASGAAVYRVIHRLTSPDSELFPRGGVFTVDQFAHERNNPSEDWTDAAITFAALVVNADGELPGREAIQ